MIRIILISDNHAGTMICGSADGGDGTAGAEQLLDHMDAGTFICGAACGGDSATVDAQLLVHIDADTLTFCVASLGIDGTAVDAEVPIDPYAATNGLVSLHDGTANRTHASLCIAGTLRIDSEISLPLNAVLHGQVAVIRQDQMYIAAEGDPLRDDHGALHHIPAPVPCGSCGIHHGGAGAGLRYAVYVQICYI